MSNKVALVTGGARRVGAAISRRLHECGMSLMVHYRQSAEEAQALQAELNAARPDSVALVASILRSAGHADVRTAGSAREAFGHLEAVTPPGETPDLVLLDIQLPDLKGTDVCRWLKALEHLQDIPEADVSIKIGTVPMEIVHAQGRTIKTVRLFRPVKNVENTEPSEA